MIVRLIVRIRIRMRVRVLVIIIVIRTAIVRVIVIVVVIVIERIIGGLGVRTRLWGFRLYAEGLGGWGLGLNFVASNAESPGSWL